MDTQKFDELARSLSSARTRRGLLRAFVAGVAATWMGTNAEPKRAEAVQLCKDDADRFLLMAAGSMPSNLFQKCATTFRSDLCAP
jgi:hypothetical protein